MVSLAGGAGGTPDTHYWFCLIVDDVLFSHPGTAWWRLTGRIWAAPPRHSRGRPVEERHQRVHQAEHGPGHQEPPGCSAQAPPWSGYPGVKFHGTGLIRPLHWSHPGVNGHRVRILPEEDIIQREQDGTQGHWEHVQDHREDSEVIVKLLYYFSENILPDNLFVLFWLIESVHLQISRGQASAHIGGILDIRGTWDNIM